MTAARVGRTEQTEIKLVSVDVRLDGIAIVTLDDPRAEHNAMYPQFAVQIFAAVSAIEEDASIAAAVFESGKAGSFVVGADLRRLKALKFASDAERIARDLAAGLRRIEASRKPIVVAVHGPALGPGFELALACHGVVASDHKKTCFGFNELDLGLIPAGNGMLRLAERTSLRTAMQLSLGGTLLRASEANRLGIVDDVCPRGILREAAVGRARALVGRLPRPRKSPRWFANVVLERNPIGRRLLVAKARTNLSELATGEGTAKERMLEVLERYASSGFASAAALEPQVFGELVVSEMAHRRIELELAATALRKDKGVDERVEPRRVERIGLIGGGLVGSRVAFTSAVAGMAVRVKVRDDAAVGQLWRALSEQVADRQVDGAWTERPPDGLFARLSVSTGFSGFRSADVVIEAISEDLAAKQAILREVEALVSPTCVYASSTSSIPISSIARDAVTPERIVGMHYAPAAARMPLLEVVRTERTAPWALAMAVAVGKKQRATVIVVRDGPGFYTTRLMAPLLAEAVRLVGEGVSIPDIDTALVGWGFPMGPLRLLDEISPEVAWRNAQALQSALGIRWAPPETFAHLVSAERTGRKNGRGFYRYSTKGAIVDPTVYDLLGVEPRTKLPAEEIQMRCVLALINEAIRCFSEGNIRSAQDGDVGAAVGLGFPKFRGGPFRYVDTIGASEMLRRTQGFADRFGERWKPAPMLAQMARKGERFYS